MVRGNASEVLSLAKEGSRTRGVDSIHSVDDAADAAIELAGELDLTVAITGEVDLVTHGGGMCMVHNGHSLMGYVTGTGCSATALIGAFLAVNPDTVEATAAALAYFGLAGEKAALKAQGPGSFQVNLLDALFSIKEEDLEKGAKIVS